MSQADREEMRRKGIWQEVMLETIRFLTFLFWMALMLVYMDMKELECGSVSADEQADIYSDGRKSKRANLRLWFIENGGSMRIRRIGRRLYHCLINRLIPRL